MARSDRDIFNTDPATGEIIEHPFGVKRFHPYDPEAPWIQPDYAPTGSTWQGYLYGAAYGPASYYNGRSAEWWRAQGVFLPMQSAVQHIEAEYVPKREGTNEGEPMLPARFLFQSPSPVTFRHPSLEAVTPAAQYAITIAGAENPATALPERPVVLAANPGLTVVGGTPGSGKTALCRAIFRRLRDGAPGQPGRRRGAPGAIAPRNPAGTVVGRRRITYIAFGEPDGGGPLGYAQDFSILMQMLATRQRGEVIFIDSFTVATVLGEALTSGGLSRQAFYLFGVISRIATAHGLQVFAIANPLMGSDTAGAKAMQSLSSGLAMGVLWVNKTRWTDGSTALFTITTSIRPDRRTADFIDERSPGRAEITFGPEEVRTLDESEVSTLTR